MLLSAGGYEQDLCDNMGDAWRVMSSKVAMSRWFGWCDSVEQMLPNWHTKLLSLLFMCISLGLIYEGHQQMLVRDANLAPVCMQDEAKVSIA